MKTAKIKKQRKGRKQPKGKISSIAKSRAGSNKGHTRRAVRRHCDYPNSNKVGAGSVTARRSLPNTILHKRNHRDSEVVGFNI